MSETPGRQPDSSVVWSDPIRFRTMRTVASLDDFGTFADSAFSLARSTFGHVESVEETVRHLSGDFVVLAIDGRTDRVAGLSTLAISMGVDLPQAQLERHGHVSRHTPIAHLQGTVVHPDVQGRGLYRELNRLRFESIVDHGIQFVSVTTQNPKVERGIRSILGELVDEKRIVNWTHDVEVLPGHYGQRLAADQTDTTGTSFAHLDRDVGDACSLLFELRYEPDE